MFDFAGNPFIDHNPNTDGDDCYSQIQSEIDRTGKQNAASGMQKLEIRQKYRA